MGLNEDSTATSALVRKQQSHFEQRNASTYHWHFSFLFHESQDSAPAYRNLFTLGGFCSTWELAANSREGRRVGLGGLSDFAELGGTRTWELARYHCITPVSRRAGCDTRGW